MAGHFDHGHLHRLTVIQTYFQQLEPTYGKNILEVPLGLAMALETSKTHIIFVVPSS